MSPVERREIRGPEGSDGRKRDSDNFDNGNAYFAELMAKTTKNAKKGGNKMKKTFFKTFSKLKGGSRDVSEEDSDDEVVEFESERESETNLSKTPRSR